jgi:cytochrome c oxidase subunit III
LSVEHAPHHPALKHHFDSLRQQHEATSLGMWVFLASEVLIFAGLFLAYALYRGKFPAEFAAGSAHQNVWIGATNTAILLASSLTMALAVRAAQLGLRSQQVLFLALTLALGTAFLVIKLTLEWAEDYRHWMVPGLRFDLGAWKDPTFGRRVELYFFLYFTMTGLHALHMVAGMGVLAVLIALARRGRFDADYYSPVELTGLYWHFVDVIWIFLFPLFYLIATGSGH